MKGKNKTFCFLGVARCLRESTAPFLLQTLHEKDFVTNYLRCVSTPRTLYEYCSGTGAVIKAALQIFGAPRLRYPSTLGFQHEIEGRFRRAAEGAEAGISENTRQTRFASLCAEREAHFLG